jgi:hypothetical protein
MARSGEAGPIDVIGIVRGRDIEVAVEPAVPGAAAN